MPLCLRTTELQSLTISLLVTAGRALPSQSTTSETLSRGRATHTQSDTSGRTGWPSDLWSVPSVTFCSMLHNKPKQRCTAKAALLSPFFSIPFGMCHIQRPRVEGERMGEELRGRASPDWHQNSVCVSVSVCVSASHWGPGSAAHARPPAAQLNRWHSPAQWWRVWR